MQVKNRCSAAPGMEPLCCLLSAFCRVWAEAGDAGEMMEPSPWAGQGPEEAEVPARQAGSSFLSEELPLLRQENPKPTLSPAHHNIKLTEVPTYVSGRRRRFCDRTW